MAQLNSLIVTGNSKLIGDTNTNAIYAAGNVKIGTSTQSTLPTTGLTIHDVRNVDITANGLNRAMNVYFSNRTSPYPSATWYSAIHMQGWNGSENYNAWELIGPANNGDQRTQPLYVRSSNGGTWGSWRQIYDSSNHDGTKVNKSGDTMSGALNLSYAASATMTYASTNPQIGFSENGSQGVKIIYTDYDSYRAPYGLKVIGDGTAGAAWFEVEGTIFCNGGKYNSYFTATPTSGQVVITDGTAGGTKSSGYTIAASVPSGAKFTDTTYTFAGGTNSFTVTPLGASAQTVSLTVSDSTKLPLTGGTMTGDIIFNKTGATDLTQVQMKCGVNDYGRVAAGGTASNSGWMEIATADDGAEPIYARQYSGVYSSIVRTATLLDASGNTSFPGILSLSKTVRKMLTGTGTAAQDKGSGVSPRYFPARWAFNIGIATPSDGEIVTIKIPCAGHDYGVFLSLDNGTTYKPISVTYGVDRLTTHYGNGTPLTLIYDASGGTNSVYAAAGADARSNVTGGCWRVMNFWDSGNTYDRNRYNAAIKAWGTKIIAGNIIVGINGLYHHLKEGTAFDITYPILYLNGDCNASATTTNTYDIIHFTSTTTQNTSWTAYKPVYIKGSLSGNTFTPISTTPLLQTVPTSEDNYYYMLLGIATATNTIYLQERHPIFAYRYNQFAEITWNSQFASFLKPVAANTSTAFSNWNIPSGSYQVWGQQFRDNRLTYTPSGGSATTITDTGDWTIWLTGNATANAATLNMRIDGTYYGSFSGNLSGNATSANISDLARRLQWTTVRMTTPNTHWNDAALRYYLSSSAMTTDKPRNLDGKIIHMPWDNDGGYASQMFVAHGQYALAALRCQNGNKDAWGSWMPMGVFSQTTPTSGQVIITDGTNGMIKSSGYTIATSVPSGAVFTDTKNTAGSTDTSSKIFLIGATSQAANPQTYSDDQVYTTSGTLQTNKTNATAGVNANTGNYGDNGGVSLYSTDPNVYGIAFRTTSNMGTHGYVTSDWATYLTMSNSNNRGWVFRRYSSGNVASIDTNGRAVFNGSVTVGGNAANTSGGRMEYNATNHCIDFIVT